MSKCCDLCCRYRITGISSSDKSSYSIEIPHLSNHTHAEFTLHVEEPGSEYNILIEAFYGKYYISDSAYGFNMSTKACLGK